MTEQLQIARVGAGDAAAVTLSADFALDETTGILTAAALLAPVSQYINTGNAGDGTPIAVLQRNGNISKIQIAPDQTIGATTLSDNLDIFLYRNGTVVGGGRFAGWDAGANPALTVGASVTVPMDATNTQVSAGKMVAQAGDVIFAKTSALACLVTAS